MSPAARVALAVLLVVTACSKEPGGAPSTTTTTSTAPPPPAPAPAPAPPPARAARPQGPAPELTLGAFKKFTKRKNPEVRHCYEAALAGDETLRGKVTLAFAILPSGGVGEVRIARSTFRSNAVPSCIAAVVRGWKTPFRPSEPVDVEYPLVFGPR